MAKKSVCRTVIDSPDKMLPFDVSANHRLVNIFLLHVYHIQMSTLGAMFIYIYEPTLMSGGGGDGGCRVAIIIKGVSALVHLKPLRMSNKMGGEFPAAFMETETGELKNKIIFS